MNTTPISTATPSNSSSSESLSVEKIIDFLRNSRNIYIYKLWAKEYRLEPAIVLSYLAIHGVTEKEALRKALRFRRLKLDSCIRRLLGKKAISRNIHSKKEIYLDILLDVPEEFLLDCWEDELRVKGVQA